MSGRHTSTGAHYGLCNDTNQMIAHILIGSAVNTASIFIMSAFLAGAILGLTRAGAWIADGPTFGRSTLSLAIVTLWMLAGISVSIWLWAAVLLTLNVFDALEPALYFSVVSLTTLGYGDIVLEPQWRLLSGFMAANGLVLFGLLTAFLFKVMDQIRKSQS